MTRFQIDLPEEQADRLGALAAFHATTPEALLAEAAQALLAEASALEAWIAEGEADAAAGRTISHAPMMAELQSIVAQPVAARGR